MLRTDAAELRALLAAYHRPGDRRRALAVAAEPTWAGPETIKASGTTAWVVAARSPLAVRAALLDAQRRADQRQASDDVLVVLTDCSGGELGLDVRARLAKGDVVPLDPYASVQALFRAEALDPRLVAERWLIDELIGLAPADGWPERQPPSGVLGAELAWQTWHELRLHVTEQPTDIAGVLALGTQPEVASALAELPADQRERVSRRWAARTGVRGAGEAAGPGSDGLVAVLVDLLAQGRGGQLVAFGLVAGVLWTPTDDASVAARQAVARARLEEVFGRDRLGHGAAGVWAEAAITNLDGNPTPAAVLDAAQQVLAAADSADLAALSDVLPLGFDQRLAVLGGALTAGDLAAAEDALAAVAAHTYGARRGNRLAMAEAAVRLLRRSAAAPAGSLPPSAAVPAAPSSFAAAVEAYAGEGAWVDAARRLLAEGDHVAEVAVAYRALADTAEAEQVERSHRFAGLLAEWSASEPLDDGRLVPVEAILEEVVAPVAAAGPVLLVVCDGMSLAVGHGLVRDLWHEGWARVAPAGRERWPVGVATLPTVTETSRASLLSGRRVVGGQAEEREGFATHPGLRAVSQPTHPPILVHKAGLVAPNGVALPDEVRDAVADPGQRVVGVVVNSVDDHLARGDQVRVGWDLLALRPLSWLLDAAAEAGRVVILTSDHGHVLHGPASESRPQGGGGERWRQPPPPAGHDEVEIAGPRVLAGDGRVVLPADDRLRYGGYKHGYHGGATPEEVLVPVEVLARRPPEGWAHQPVHPPAWWSPESASPALPAAGPTPAPLAAPRRPAPSAPATLFDDRPAEPAVGDAEHAGETGDRWVRALLAAPAFVAHRQRTRLPRPIADDRLRSYLEAIVANGGSIPLAALAERTGEPPDTLRLALSPVQRLLNVDGTAVLVVHAETVELNRRLANMQFEIDDINLEHDSSDIGDHDDQLGAAGPGPSA